MMSTGIPAVFLVQTDEIFAQQASLELKSAGYLPMIFPKADRAWREFKKQEPTMLILDRPRAGEAGIKLCHRLRSSGSKVILLLLLDQETVEERVATLEVGADDYLLKPHHGKDFLQRVQFYLKPKDVRKEQLCFGPLVLDLSSRRLFLDGEAIALTLKEFELLKYLMSHPQEILTREEILENVWGSDFKGASNVIEVYIRYLRLKVEQAGQKRLIHTARGIGYVLRET